MRPFLVLLAAWLAFALPAEAGPVAQRVGRGGPIVAATTPTPAPLASTFLGYDNISPATTTNNGITLPASSTTPPGGQNPWLWVQRFKYDDQAGNTPSGTAPLTLAGACGSVACTGGSDRSLQVQNPNQTATLTKQREILFSAKRGGGTTQMWATPCGAACSSTGVQLVANQNYCVVIAQYASGAMSISANDNTGAPAVGSPSVAAGPNNTPSPGSANYYYATGSASPAAQTNIFNALGTTVATTNVFGDGMAGPLGEAAFINGSLSNTSGTPSAVALQDLCNGKMTLGTWITTYVTSPTLTSYYPLNNPNASPPTSFPSGTTTGFTPTITTAATVIAGASASIIPGSPLDPLQCLTLNEKGPYDVAPLDAGQSGSGVGTIRVSGTVNANACGFAPSTVDAQIVSINSGNPVTGWINTPVVAGKYSVFVGGVPGSITANGSYKQSVRLHEAPAYVVNGQFPISVGFPTLRAGQSQVVFMTNPGTAGSGTGSQLAGNGTLSFQVMNASDSGNVKGNQGGGQASMVLLDAVNNPGAANANQLAGDGIVEEGQDLAAYLGVPIKVVSMAKAGQASDAWAEDYQPQTSTLSGSGTGAYSSATIFTAAVPTGAGANATFLGTTFNTSGNTTMTALHGSVVLYDANGVPVAIDNSAGAFTGTNINAGGSLNYLTGAISGVTFTTSQASPLVAHWTMIEDTAGGANTQQNPYVGFPTFGDGVHATSGYATQVLSQNYQPFSATVMEQCTTDATAMATTSPPANNNAGYPLSWQTKWNYTLQTKLAAFGWFRANNPVMVLGYSRDTNDPVNNVATCRQVLFNFATSGAPYNFGNSYIDVLNQCTGTVLCLGPHEGPYLMGGRRMGRRAAASLCALQQQDTKCTPISGSAIPVVEPTITVAARVGTTITFTVSGLNAVVGGGTPALTNCGTNLSNGASPPPTSTNTCSPPGSPVGTAVFGFAFGLATNTMYNFQGVNWQGSTPDDTKTHSCNVASTNTITCTGAWFATGMFWSYAAGGPFQEAGSIKALSVAGTGYTGAGSNSVTGTGATNAAGGTCTHATASIHQSGGVVTASRVTVGNNACVGTDTFPITGLSGGAGYAVSGLYWTALEDVDHVGQLLYDNSLGCGGTISGTTYEPGCLVRPVPIPQGPLS